MTTKGYRRLKCKRGHILDEGNRAKDNGSCKICNRKRADIWMRNNKERYKLNHKIWATLNKEHLNLLSRVRKRGMTIEEYRCLLKKQHNKCAICGAKFGKNNTPNIDHSHVSGKTRELLCANCNHLLGHAKEDVKILRRAISYILKHERGLSARHKGIRNTNTK